MPAVVRCLEVAVAWYCGFISCSYSSPEWVFVVGGWLSSTRKNSNSGIQVLSILWHHHSSWQRGRSMERAHPLLPGLTKTSLHTHVSLVRTRHVTSPRSETTRKWRPGGEATFWRVYTKEEAWICGQLFIYLYTLTWFYLREKKMPKTGCYFVLWGQVSLVSIHSPNSGTSCGHIAIYLFIWFHFCWELSISEALCQTQAYEWRVS